jgi:Patatin-like phospholipase
MSTQNQKCLEVGLVLAGAVSAGAYTAGVMDFLLEALEAWEQAKAKNATIKNYYKYDNDDNKNDNKEIPVPKHNLKIKVISGASAGGMTAAMTAVEIRRRSFNQGRAKSLFYEAWVEMIDIKQLLSCDDLKMKEGKDKKKDKLQKDGIKSLLNATIINEIADKIIKIESGTNWTQLPYVTSELKIYLSLSNLRGIPYKFNLAGETGFPYEMSTHADYQYVEIHEKTGEKEWEKLKDAAIATGAFPIGLSARIIKRSKEEYQNRLKMDGLPASKLMELGGEDYFDFVAVDGGLLNNEPIELAKSALYAHEKDALQQENTNKQIFQYLAEESKLLDEFNFIEEQVEKEAGRVPEARHEVQLNKLYEARKITNDKLKSVRTRIETLKKKRGKEFSNAILLIDPFPNVNKETTNPKSEDTDLMQILGPVISAMRSQCLFKPEELLISTSDDIYDRFLIAPIRQNKNGVNQKHNPLASGFFEGFGGFLSHDFRNHDYYLGRKNCQQFLKYYFSVPYEYLKENEIFKDTINPEFAFLPPGTAVTDPDADKKKRYPLIPLVDDLAIKPEPTPEWPTYSVDEFNTFKGLLATRISSLLNKAVPVTSFTKAWWAAFVILLVCIVGIHIFLYYKCGSWAFVCSNNYGVKFILSVTEILLALTGATILIFQVVIYTLKTWAKNKVVALVESYLKSFNITIK